VPAADVELACEFDFGGQHFAALEFTGEDGLPDGFLDLLARAQHRASDHPVSPVARIV